MPGSLGVQKLRAWVSKQPLTNMIQHDPGMKKHDHRTNLTRSQEGHNRPLDPSRMHIQVADSVFFCVYVSYHLLNTALHRTTCFAAASAETETQRVADVGRCWFRASSFNNRNPSTANGFSRADCPGAVKNAGKINELNG